METPNKNLQAFAKEHAALCKKYGVAFDIQAQIVVVELSSKKNPDAKEDKESLGLVTD